MTSSADSPIAFAQGSGALPMAAGKVTFGEIYAAHFQFVWRAARRLGGGGDSVDDVVQEIFVIVHRRLPSRQGHVPIRAWLYAIVVNVTRNHRRRVRRLSVERPESGTLGDVERVASEGPLPDESFAHEQARRALEKILDALDDEKLEVFVLSDLEQLPVPEIAELLGIKPTTVSGRLRAARQEVAEAMTRHRARDGWRLK